MPDKYEGENLHGFKVNDAPTSNLNTSQCRYSPWIHDHCCLLVMCIPGEPRGMLPQKNFEILIGSIRLLLRPFLGQYNASRRPDDRVGRKPHPSQMKPNNCPFVRTATPGKPRVGEKVGPSGLTGPAATALIQ